jgi:hypothetical protein
MRTNAAVTPYRPVGPEELALIRLRGFPAFPPRLRGSFPALSAASGG